MRSVVHSLGYEISLFRVVCKYFFDPLDVLSVLSGSSNNAINTFTDYFISFSGLYTMRKSTIYCPEHCVLQLGVNTRNRNLDGKLGLELSSFIPKHVF